AAGAVMWRAGEDGIETALVHRSRYDDWSFPKGKAMPGEHVLLTAVREVAEETGTRVTLGRRLAATQYLTSGGPKRGDYWAGLAGHVHPRGRGGRPGLAAPGRRGRSAQLRPRRGGTGGIRRRAGRHHPGDLGQARRRPRQEGLAPGRPHRRPGPPPVGRGRG